MHNAHVTLKVKLLFSTLILSEYLYVYKDKHDYNSFSKVNVLSKILYTFTRKQHFPLIFG